MAGKQTKLPFGKENTIPNEDPPNEDPQQSLRDVSKMLDRARKAVNVLVTGKITSRKNASRSDKIAALDKAIALLQVMDPQILPVLNRERSVLAQELEKALKHRRENLMRLAKKAGWPFKRLAKYDYVRGFQVDYKLERVTLSLGSESLTAFNEPDGAGLFSRLKEERLKLDKFPFNRQGFIESMKGAIYLAKRQGKDRGGKVPIRALYPLFVLTRHSCDEHFMKRPVPKFFTDYSMAQFVFDLARFGLKGWKTEQGERLRNQPPNMASIAKRATVTLPTIDKDGSGGTQLGAMWIDRM